MDSELTDVLSKSIASDMQGTKGAEEREGYSIS